VGRFAPPELECYNVLNRLTGGISLLYAVAFVVLVLDRLTKYYAYTVLQMGGPIPVISGVLRLAYSQNNDAAFGLLQHQRVFFIVVTVALVAGIIVYINTNPVDRWQLLALGLLTGGALGNLVDRIARGFVVDFIDLSFWPTFNVADSAIVIGAGAMVLYILLVEMQQEQRPGEDCPDAQHSRT
jgi:signal peptidase II